jgi:hypothetical protein
MDYPDIASVMGLEVSPDDYPKYAFLGLLLDSWEIGYSLSTMSAKAVQVPTPRAPCALHLLTGQIRQPSTQAARLPTLPAQNRKIVHTLTAAIDTPRQRADSAR